MIEKYTANLIDVRGFRHANRRIGVVWSARVPFTPVITAGEPRSISYDKKN